MDGLEVTHLIRKHEQDHPSRKKTRIIALTANVLGQDREYYLSKGMDDYIPKPFKIEDILSKLDT
jgi:CheY-like chemotaxis protein